MNASQFSTAFMFSAILLALLLVLLLAWINIRVCTRLGWIDYPGSEPHKQHNRPTPLAGGLALFSTLLIAELASGSFNDRNVLLGFLPATLIFALGLWDDLRPLPPVVKLSGQVLAALILIRLGIYIQIFESPEFFLHGGDQFNLGMDWLLTVLWVVGITNAFNFVDSMDGLAVGLGGMAAAFFMLVTLASEQPMLSLQSALLIGICIGLYFFNSPPALLFLGDSGAQTLGFVLSVLAIVYRPLGANQSSSWFVPIMLLGVPIFDATLVVFSRLRRKRPIYWGSQDHTYHRLVALGLDRNRSVLLMHVAAMLLGSLAFVILPQPPLIANLVFAAVLLVGFVILVLLDRPKRWL